MMNLRTVLRSESSMKNLIDELAQTPAFNMLFGRIISGTKARPGVGKRAFQHILDAFGKDHEVGFENMRSHAVPVLTWKHWTDKEQHKVKGLTKTPLSSTLRPC